MFHYSMFDKLKLWQNMYVFSDINECEYGNCQQACINYPGAYNCSCYDGYRISKSDHKQCDGKRTNQQQKCTGSAPFCQLISQLVL